jgi:hypothetical protein
MKLSPGDSTGTYRPSLLLTVTYSGFTTTYYRYSVPMTLTVQ